MSNAVGALHQRLVFTRRTRVLAESIGRLLPAGANVLDVGCGDGTIDWLILERRPDLTIRGIDVLVRPATKIPVDRFNGTQLPCASKCFDVVSFVDVLHHTDDPIVLLREAKRVARKLVLLKDHTMDGPFAYPTLRLMDWVGNAHHDVALPYNYWPKRKWQEAFVDLRMPIVHWQSNLGLYPFPASLIFERRLHFIAGLGVA
jgi:ubiquinone/menaquinone biosynthesis C-methylase UbiE